jgi:hypothetical protein
VVGVSDEYPPEWSGVAKQIKDEADWECECCGHPHESEPPWVLTVHHLDGDKSNLNDWNLAALCQRCYLQIQTKLDWYTDTLTGIHTEWIAEHVRKYNEWACEPDEPELTLTGTRPNRRPYWDNGSERA